MSQARVAVDIGTQFAKIITGAGPGDADRVRIRPAGPGGSRAVLAEVAVTGPALCLAVPDAWLNGGEAGARKQETLRAIAEDELGLTRVRWAGQLAAVAALAASRRALTDAQVAAGPQADRYLVCDVGGVGVRVGVCEVSVTPGSGYAARQVAIHAVQGGGWRDVDTAVRAALGANGDPALATWHEQAISQTKRARLVFDRARAAPDFLSARVYTLAGTGTSYELTAEQAVECFGPTADRIKAGVRAVLAGADKGSADKGSADEGSANKDGANKDGADPNSAAKGLTTVLTGGLAWFPLAAAALTELTGSAPLILRPEAAARGALLLADGQAALGGCGLPRVSLPMREVTDGLLAEVSVPLPWTASFGAEEGEGEGEPLYIDDAELVLDIGASRVTVPLPGLAAGPYRAAARPSWAGSGVLVLRADQRPDTMTWPGAEADAGVHVVPLGPYAEGKPGKVDS